MQTAWRSRERTARRARRAHVTVGLQAHAEISPVWEILPWGHAEVGPRSGVAQRDAVLRRSLAAADVVAALAALLVVTGLIDPGRVHPTVLVLLSAPFVLLVGKVIGLYDRDPHLLHASTIDEAPSIFYLAVVCVLGLWICEVVLLRGALARPQVLGLVFATFVLAVLGRLTARRLLRALLEPERCIVVGAAEDAERISSKFGASPAVNATVIGRVDPVSDPHPDPERRIERLGDCEQLSGIVARHRVHRVIVASHGDGQDQVLDVIRLVKALGVKVSVIPRLLEVVGSSSTFDEVDGMWLMGVRQFGLTRSSDLLKRAMDVAIASTVLLLLAPLFAMLTIAVKLDGSGGPVFFRQPRVGRRGERFWMLKFRSMVPDAEARKAQLAALNEAGEGLFKIERDPRITRPGRILRRTSLDELPQLLNVLRGDMSLVGPRPLVPDEDALITGWRRRRLAVKPGMTGLWQIFGSARIPMHEMVNIDYVYGANWSLWLDLRILLRTIPYVLARRGQ